MIIALTGAAGCGKSTAAAYLVERHGFVRARFAGPLKAMLRGFLAGTGVDAETAERMVEGDLKEVPCDELAGRSPRFVMQTLGTEWGREIVAPDFWTHAWQMHVARLAQAGHGRIVVDDCRFTNEAEVVRGAGGFVLRIKRPGQQTIATSGHASETQPVEADATIWNDGTPEVLGWRLDGIVTRIVNPYVPASAA